MYFLRILLIPVLLLASVKGTSQTRRFQHLTSADGLSQSEVYAFLNDSRGFMWFGTLDGLNKYDGNSIEIFNTEKGNPYTLSNNTIRSLAEDKKGRIWIGTDDGLNLYDPNTELIHQVHGEDFEEKFTVWSLLVDGDHLFAGTREGLWKASITSDKIEEIEFQFTKIKRISNNENQYNPIRSIQKSKYGGLWIISTNYVSRIFLPENSNDSILINDISFNNFTSQIAGIEDKYGNLWIASSNNGLVRYNAGKNSVLYFDQFEFPYRPSSNNCSSLAIDTSGNLWVGTQNAGINFIKSDQLNNETILFERIQHKPGNQYSLKSNLVYSLYVSNDNHLWVGTIGSGVNIFNPEQKKFEHYMFYDQVGKPSVSNFIRSVSVYNRNEVLIGTHNNGLFIYSLDNESYRKLGFDTDAVFDIKNFMGNKFFVCTNKGIHLVEINSRGMQLLSRSNVFQDAAVFYVERSKPGVFWYASLNGIVRFSVVDDKIITNTVYSEITTPATSANNCRVILFIEDSNELFVGTEGGGLDVFILDENHFPEDVRIYKKKEESTSLSNNYIRSIVKDKNQNIWIGTYEGLNKMIIDSISKVSFESYTIKDGLPNNMIQFITEDSMGNLWMGTNGGLSKFDPVQKCFTNYYESYGIQSNEFSEHTVCKRNNGEIIMGGVNGFNTFHPDQIEPSKLKSKTNLTGFYLNSVKMTPQENTGRNVPLKKSIVLSDSIILLPKQRNIGIEFSAMIYPNSKNAKYEYTLQGFNDDWHITDANDRIANYTNLRYGEYIFKVRGSNADGIWGSTRQVYVHIQKPFRLTWMAYVIYALIVLLILFYFSHFTIIRYTTKNRLVLEKEHSQKLHELNELRTKFFINISHDLRTPLSLISGPLEKLQKSDNLNKDIKKTLDLIQRNVKRLSFLVEQLLDIRKAESGTLTPRLMSMDIISFTKEEAAHFTYAIKKKGLKLKIHSVHGDLDTSFDPGMLSKVLFNLISNAIKYTEKGRIEISVKKVRKESNVVLVNGSCDYYVKVEVHDTGKGIDKDTTSKIFDRFFQDRENNMPGYGIGLSHARELINAHEGFIELDSKVEIGTTIRFFIPYINPKEQEERSASTEDIFINENDHYEISSGAPAKFDTSILVVEDNDDMRRFIAEELMKSFNVFQAADGIEALKIAESKTPDLIVSDIIMSNMDGIELCQNIKSNIKISHIPVILLTAKIDAETKYKGIELGADDFIPKPFEIEYLILRINNILRARKELQKLFQKNHIIEPSSVTVTTVDEKFMEDLRNALEEELSNSNFSINSLEAKMGMSHANFYRKIKSLTGQSGQELLHSMRMRRAHQILSENKGIRVSEVAYMVGFTNPKYFSKCFKEMFGYAPTMLRED